MTKKEAAVIDRARELIQASDGRSLYLAPGGRIDVDVMLYAALSRAVVELRSERGEPRFVEEAAPAARPAVDVETRGIAEYRKAFSSHMAARAQADDTLTEEQESEWSAKMDGIWDRLTRGEREYIEQTEAPLDREASRSWRR